MNFIRFAKLQWDRVGAVVAVVAGGLMIVIGWVGVSRAALTAQQLPYIISGGIGGLFLLGVGGVLWLSADLRDEWRKLDAIEHQERSAVEDAPTATVDDPFLVDAEARSSNGRPKQRRRAAASAT